jgi:hypothetical protein
MPARRVTINGREQIDPRQTRAWRKLRDQVVAEEPTCGWRSRGSAPGSAPPRRTSSRWPARTAGPTWRWSGPTWSAAATRATRRRALCPARRWCSAVTVRSSGRRWRSSDPDLEGTRVPSYEVTCAGCGKVFTAKSPRAKWHSPGCKKQAQRNPPPPRSRRLGRRRSTRSWPRSARSWSTRQGRDRRRAGALLLAGQAVAAGATNVGTLIRQMREVLDAALGRKPGAVDPPAAEPEAPPAAAPDELTKARKSRERKLAQARQAADRA